MIVAMFRTYLKPQANLDELGMLHQKMHAIVTNMPGFIAVAQIPENVNGGATHH